jgi:flavorubredoxin
MRSVVVCESWFGNTERVARAVADELARHGEARFVSVSDEIGDLDEVDLLVVGAPTHVHGLSSSISRKSAIEQSGARGVQPGPGARGWFESLPEGMRGKAAAFDTRIEKSSMLTGSAAKGIAKRLRQHGLALVAEPESFFVLDTGGPLKEGELERATYWAQDLAAAVANAVETTEEPVTA